MRGCGVPKWTRFFAGYALHGRRSTPPSIKTRSRNAKPLPKQKQARDEALTCEGLVARTRFELVISALRGRRPKPLDERAVSKNKVIVPDWFCHCNTFFRVDAGIWVTSVSAHGLDIRETGDAGMIGVSAGGTDAARVCATCFGRAFLDPRSLPNWRFCLILEAGFHVRALWHPLSPQVGGTVCETPYFRCRFFQTKGRVRK